MLGDVAHSCNPSVSKGRREAETGQSPEAPEPANLVPAVMNNRETLPQTSWKLRINIRGCPLTPYMCHTTQVLALSCMIMHTYRYTQNYNNCV